jgi:hypothetical protein
MNNKLELKFTQNNFRDRNSLAFAFRSIEAGAADASNEKIHLCFVQHAR